MNRVAAVMKIHFINKRSWFHIPWLIVALSFVANIIAAYFVNVPIYTGALSSIYCYMIATGVITLTNTFPFALGMSARRTDFFVGTLYMAIFAGVITSSLLLLLSAVEKATGWWGVDLHFFHLPFLSDGSNLQQLWVYFSLLMNMYFCGFSISSIYRRFDMAGLVTLFTALFLLGGVASVACTYYQWWDDILKWLTHSTASGLANWLAPVTAAYIIASYLLLQRAKA